MNETKTLVVNLYGGPSTGKSTTAAGVFYHLKQKGVNCELAREYAKDVVWKEATSILSDQNYIFAKQNNKLQYLVGKVDVIITDSPLLLSLIYGDQEPETFKQHVLSTYRSYNNLNIMLNRVKKFNPSGRLQTEEEAKVIDQTCRDLLAEHEFGCIHCDADEQVAEKLANYIQNL